MFAITADQRGSRSHPDLVPQAIARLSDAHGTELLLPPDQNAGDELQLLTPSARTVLRIVLELTRTGAWSVGVGAGTVEEPMPAATRMARGSALLAARNAVERAKRHPARFAMDSAAAPLECDTASATIALLIALRDKRSDQGWAVWDALEQGLSRKELAARLGISHQAVGNRVAAGAIRVERESHPALERLLEAVDAAQPQSGKG